MLTTWGAPAACAAFAVGERVRVKVSDDVEYYVVIRGIKKGADDDSLPISRF